MDVGKIVTGFRKTEFKGGAGSGGVYLNDKFIYLKGFAQRARTSGPGSARPIPDWMHDFNAQLMRDCNANYVRWMHVSPQPVDVRGVRPVRHHRDLLRPATRSGGAGPPMATARGSHARCHDLLPQQPQYFRSGRRAIPSLLPSRCGRWSPCGKSAIRTAGGSWARRGNSDTAANAALTPVSEYYGVMIGQDRRTDRVTGPNDIFRGYSIARRDRARCLRRKIFATRRPAATGTIPRRLPSASRKAPRTPTPTRRKASPWLTVGGIGPTGRTAFPIPTRRTRSGRVTPRSIFPIPTPMGGKSRARSAARAARWTRSVCPRRPISPSA